MVTFDSPQRNVCVSRRVRTNTPLQALTTLNDTVYTEAAQHLAQFMNKSGRTIPDKIAAGYRRIMFRQPAPAKLVLLEKLYTDALPPRRKPSPVPDPNALALVANALLNLDETLTK